MKYRHYEISLVEDNGEEINPVSMCLKHMALLDEIDRLQEALNDARKGWEQASAQLNGAIEIINKQRETIERLQQIEAAAQNLAKVRGRHNSEIAYQRLLEALK